MKFKKLTTIGAALLVTLSLAACGNNNNKKSSQESATKVTATSNNESSTHKSSSKSHHKQVASHTYHAVKQRNNTILKKMIYETNHESAGPTGNYYYVIGQAKDSGFADLKRGEYHFTSDSEGRSSTARAVLTYSEYQSSKGSRQGDPLAPPSWPSDNPEVAIHYSLTGRTYHGYLYNRSHSIGDSLLGTKSYTSQYNFTTGTRPQNVGANQGGGMRYAEETAENYWENNPGTSSTIEYETTPLYKGTETIPRGSIVNIKSSDGAINTSIAVINSVEGIKINYDTGSSNAKPITHMRPQMHHHKSSTSYGYGNRDTRHKNQSTRHSPNNQTEHSTTKQGQWTVAGAGMVFVSDSNKFYSEVTNPGNYQYMSESKAQTSGATRAARGNQYARP